MRPTSALEATAVHVPTLADEIKVQILRALRGATQVERPYCHYLVDHLFPSYIAQELAGLPFVTPAIDGVTGTREAHNDTRRYFDTATMTRFPVLRAVAEALQSADVVRVIAERFDAALDGTFLRLEYAQDIDGFWLQPHTDLGVKKFTGLIYLSDGLGHEDLGTDIYASATEHAGRSPFRQNAAMIFVPGADTWHGFEKRPIQGVRRSAILNYVTQDWRAREQLSFPTEPIKL